MNKLLIALDVDDRARALSLVDDLKDIVGGFKVGSQLFLSEGPEIIETLTAQGARIFLDLKFHDIPNTVANTVSAAVKMGVWMLTVHTMGGIDMLRAAEKAAIDSAKMTKHTKPIIVGVTVLTSHNPENLPALGITRPLASQVKSLALMAKEAGLDGVVCSPLEAASLREQCGQDFVLVTPGIRSHHSTTQDDDQKRTLGPSEALRAGSNYLVVGRPVIAAQDPRAAAKEIVSQL